MKNRSEESATLKIVTTGFLIVAVILSFYCYSVANHARVQQRSADYIKNFTVETAGWVNNVLENACYSIDNISVWYGKTLTGKTIDHRDLKTVADNTMFDNIEFIDTKGIRVNANGDTADLSDRFYFQSGMRGESGMGGVYVYPVTGERIVLFYAPVKYQDEIIGVLLGHYREERMQKILYNTFYGETAPTLLCLADGTIVASVGMDDAEGSNALAYMQDHVSAQDLEGIRQALFAEEEYAFSCEMKEGETIGYVASLSENRWTIIQFFPPDALERVEKDGNDAGIMLETALVLIFGVYMVILLVQEWKRRKRLATEKAEVERIIAGINRLFSRFILVSFKDDTYRYLNGQKPTFKDFPVSGAYADFLNFFKDKYVSGYNQISMKQVMSKDYIQGKLREDVLCEQYEYQLLRDGENVWENIAVIPIEWKDGDPVTVLLAIQEITELKKQELRAQDAMRDAYQTAEAANHAKGDFLSRMSHNIRTPLNAIMGMTAVAEVHMDDKARLKDCLNKINFSSQRLLSLVSEVLDMSKIESGKMELLAEEFEMSEMVANLIDVFRPQMEEKKQKFSVTLGKVTHEQVIGDEQRLSQALINILENAVQFTPEEGEISLHISEMEGRTPGNSCYEFTVTDNGIGMSAEFMKRMFEPFVQEVDSRISKNKGTGLGLSISKNIVSMMNGDILVQSKKGEGTRVKVIVFLRYVANVQEELNFPKDRRLMVLGGSLDECRETGELLESLKLPYDCYTDEEEALAELQKDANGGGVYAAVFLDQDMSGKDALQIAGKIREKAETEKTLPAIFMTAYDPFSIREKAHEAGVDEILPKPLFSSKLVHALKRFVLGQEDDQSGSTASVGQDGQFAGKRLLLVEDNEVNMEIAYEILSLAGFQVDKAENGKEAVDRLMETEPGTYRLVLMDIQMPVMDGYTAVREIRKSGRPDLEMLPVFAITADAFSEDVRKAEAAGMNGHIEKPINIDKMIALLKEWVN